jgi:hypothetical protein
MSAEDVTLQNRQEAKPEASSKGLMTEGASVLKAGHCLESTPFWNCLLPRGALLLRSFTSQVPHYSSLESSIMCVKPTLLQTPLRKSPHSMGDTGRLPLFLEEPL